VNNKTRLSIIKIIVLKNWIFYGCN
jgi:hypothetical protein